MADLEFFDRRKRRPLVLDTDGGYAITRQYDGWFARTSDAATIPAIRLGADASTLEWDVDLQGYILPKTGVVDDVIRAMVGAAGLLSFCAAGSDDAAPDLEPALYVGPASLDEDEFAAILDRLGQMAVMLSGAARAPVSVGVGLHSQTSASRPRLSIHERLRAKAQAICDLHSVCQGVWPLIVARPASTVRLTSQTVDVANPMRIRGPGLLRRVALRPDVRRLEIALPDEDFDCQENRFLAYLLGRILFRRANLVAGLLKRRSTWLRSDPSEPETRTRYNYLRLWEQGRATAEDEAQRLDQLTSQLEKVALWSKQQLAQPFIRVARTRASIPTRPSPRLLTSKEYGPTYRAYQRFQQGHEGQVTDKTSDLIVALDEHNIHTAQHLYELWCFLEVYTLLVDRFGFEPIGKTPLDFLGVQRGQVTLPEGASFELLFRPINDDEQNINVNLKLTYERTVRPPICDQHKACYRSDVCRGLPCFHEIMQTRNWTSGLKPDIFIEATTPYMESRFGLDAKYRRYEKQKNSSRKECEKFKVGTVFELDLLGTAKMKYLDGLGLDAVFIVHSDPDSAYTLLGAEPLKTPPLREQLAGISPYYPAHRFGAVFCSPSDQSNLEKVIRCFLMYHLDVNNVCWSCRRVLTSDNGGLRKQAGWVGDYFQCDNCGRFWIRTVCHGRDHHPLIRMGSDSFHLTMPNDVWKCICPKCGDELGGPSTAYRGDVEIAF